MSDVIANFWGPFRSGDVLPAEAVSTTLSSALSSSATTIAVSDVSIFPQSGDPDITYTTHKEFFYVAIGNATSPTDVELVAITGVDPAGGTLTVAKRGVGSTGLFWDAGTPIAIAPSALMARCYLAGAPIIGSLGKPGFLTFDGSLYRKSQTLPASENDAYRDTSGPSLIQGDFSMSWGLANSVEAGASHAFLYGNQIDVTLNTTHGTNAYQDTIGIGRVLDVCTGFNVLIGFNSTIGNDSVYSYGIGRYVTLSDADNCSFIGHDATISGVEVHSRGGYITSGANSQKVIVSGYDISFDDVTDAIIEGHDNSGAGVVVKDGTRHVRKGLMHAADLDLGTDQFLAYGSQFTIAFPEIDLTDQGADVAIGPIPKNVVLVIDKVGFIPDADNWDIAAATPTDGELNIYWYHFTSGGYGDLLFENVDSLDVNSPANGVSFEKDLNVGNAAMFFRYDGTDPAYGLGAYINTADSNGVILGGFPYISGRVFNLPDSFDPTAFVGGGGGGAQA